MRRHISLLAAFVIIAATPSVAVAAVPDYQRVIVSRHADAALASLDGCVLTEIFVSGMDGAFGGRPGPINRQGLTGVGVRQSDICGGAASMGRFGIHAAGDGSGALLFDGLGQTLDPLTSNVHFSRAWLRASVPVINEASLGAEAVVVSVDLTWSVVGALDRDTGHLHVRRPGEGNVVSHQNTRMGDATVSGSVTIGDEEFAFNSVDGGHLEEVKYGCQVVAHPTAGEPDLSC
jgi:hypothetical protein